MTPEQFEALLQMVSAMADARVTAMKYEGNHFCKGYIEAAYNRSDEMVAEARKLLVVEPQRDLTGWLFVTEPPRELTGCQHLRGFRVEAVNGSRWSCCGEAYGP